MELIFQKLIASAKSSGAAEAGIIRAGEIPATDHLAEFCRNPGCEYYGLSMNCPPHVEGPPGFRKLLRDFSHGLVFSFEVPAEVLLSEDRIPVFGHLHETGAGIEAQARQMGLSTARAFAGGSCKQIFCQDRPECIALKKGNRCRYPDRARPSMSGFGIDVSAIMKAAGFSMTWMNRHGKGDDAQKGTICGLVLIC